MNGWPGKRRLLHHAADMGEFCGNRLEKLFAGRLIIKQLPDFDAGPGYRRGLNDLAKEMRAQMTPDRIVFQPILSLAVCAARAHGVTVLDGVCNEFRDLGLFEAEARQGALFGFDGKSLIHPAQVEPCNTVFSPSAEELAWAQAIIAAFALPENHGKGVINLEGKMIELLHLDQARRTVALVQHGGEAE